MNGLNSATKRKRLSDEFHSESKKLEQVAAKATGICKHLSRHQLFMPHLNSSQKALREAGRCASQY